MSMKSGDTATLDAVVGAGRADETGRPARVDEDHFRRTWLIFTAGWLVVAGLLARLAAGGTPSEHVMLGLAVVISGSLPAAWQVATRAKELPVFPIVMLIYGFGYGLPVFTTDPQLWIASAAMYALPADRYVTEALGLALVGIIALQVGYVLVRRRPVRPRSLVVRLELDPVRAQLALSAIGIFALLIFWATVTGRFVVLSQFGALASVLRSLSWVAIAALYSYHLQGTLPRGAQVALLTILGGETLLALSTGSLTAVLFPWIIVSAVYWRHRGQLPARYVVAGLLIFGLLQPVKQEFRYWTWMQGYNQASALDRVVLFGEIGVRQWTQIAAGGSESLELVTRMAAGRGNYLHAFAHSVSYTPGLVPYWNGSTYSYLLITFVPRAVWPQKPAAQQANDDYAVAYHLLPLEWVGRTMIGLPHLVEAFINFGRTGVPLVMAILGMVYGLLDRLFNHRRAGEGGAAIYAVLMIAVLSIESATAGVFGGLVQNAIVLFVILWPLSVRGGEAADGDLAEAV
jgi:hypothetical protein